MSRLRQCSFSVPHGGRILMNVPRSRSPLGALFRGGALALASKWRFFQEDWAAFSDRVGWQG
jgi:hypothetical protein